MKKLTHAENNVLITNNASKFVTGKTMSFTAFKNLFKGRAGASVLTNKTMRGGLDLVGHYTALNKVLAYRGMCIESSEYYTKFTIVADPSTKAKNKAATGRRKIATAKRLSSGVKYNPTGVWRPLSQSALDSL